MFEDRIEREKAFHDVRFDESYKSRAKARKYYSIMGSTRTHYIKLVSQYCKGKRLLEYGCGIGSHSDVWIKLGAIVTGIDISSEAIKKAKTRFPNSKYEASYYVMNAEQTDFHDNYFDVVVGTGIIHHLDLNNSYAELSRILNVDGHAIFIEPLGHNPLINLYRHFTSSMRTEDEHPLLQKDIQLANQYFSDVKAKYFSLFAILAVPFRDTIFFNSILSFLQFIDKYIMFYFPFVKKYAWMVVLDMSHPKS